MGWDDLKSQAKDENDKDREKWVGAYIGAVAVLLAICAMGGANSTKEATLKSVEASNRYAFYQAKSIRRNDYGLQAFNLEVMLKASPALSAADKDDLKAKIATYRSEEVRLKSEAKEGMDALLASAKVLQEDRDVALRKDPYFDFGQAFLQIAIVLASVALITGGWPLLMGSFGCAVFGVIMTLNGFFLLVKVPFIES